MPRDRSTIEDLRRVIDCLNIETREAMLEGIRSNDIIVGAYSDRSGGVCPMLAAHRCGGRTSFVAFARAWDTFTGVKRTRLATERELAVLERHIVASLAAERGRSDFRSSTEFAGVIAEHQAAKVTRVTERPPRSRRIGHGVPVDLAAVIAEHQASIRARNGREAEETGGWSFLRERRERQDAERALERVERERDFEREQERERELV